MTESVAEATTTFEGFSISHAAILDGTTLADDVVGDIYGVRSGGLEADTDSYDNTGDDGVKSSWFWFNFATLSIQAGYMPFKLIALLQGSTVTSSPVGSDFAYSTPLWNQKSLNQPTKPVIVRVPSKNALGEPRVMDFVLYKVQFSPINFDGPSYKDGLLINYTGRVLMSSYDETGAPLAEEAPGRIINGPQT